jgi:hypothetical protein
MKRVISTFLSCLAASRAGPLLVVINLGIIAFEYILRVPPTVYEPGGDCFTVSEATMHLLPAELTVSKFLNLPALVPTSVIVVLVMMLFPDICLHTAGQISVVVFLVCGTIQWWLIGYGLEGYLRRR